MEPAATGIAQSLLAAAADAKPPVSAAAVSGGLAVVVQRRSSEAHLAAAEVETARSAAANLRSIEREVLAEINEIIGRADAPQLGDDRALRELHAMLAKARAHVQGPLALAEARAKERLAAAATKPEREGGDQMDPSAPQLAAALTRRVQLHAAGAAYHAWRCHCRRAARGRRAVERRQSAQVGAAFHGLREATRLLVAQRTQEAYRLAMAELQARVATQEQASVELLARLASAQAAEASAQAAAPQEQVVLAVNADEAALATTPTHGTPRIGDSGAGWIPVRLPHSELRCVPPQDERSRDIAAPTALKFSKAEVMASTDDDQHSSCGPLQLGMVELRCYRRQEPDTPLFGRPYLIYEYEVAAGAEVWQGEKRYTDFEQLHNNVVEILGEAATGVLEVRNMALPPKRYVGNLTPEVGDERLLVLQHYLTQLGHLASLAAAASGELSEDTAGALQSALTAFVRDRHEVVAAEFVVAAAASYFEQVEQLREVFANCDTKGTGRLTEADLVRFLSDSKFPADRSSDVAEELRELQGSGLIGRLKQTLAAEVHAMSDNGSGLTLGDVESWWSQQCLRTQSASAVECLAG